MNKSALATVFLVVMIDLLGFGIVLPLLPFYAQEFSASAVTIGLLYSVYSFMQLIFSPIWGSWSDRIGRRPIMLLSTFGAVLAYIIFGLAESVGVLFLSRIVAGMMGGNISTAQAYIADVTDSENRARGMGLIGAAFGIGFVIGPATATGLIHPAFHEFVADWGYVNFAEWMSNNRFALPGFFCCFSFILQLFDGASEASRNGGYLQRKGINISETQCIYTPLLEAVVRSERKIGQRFFDSSDCRVFSAVVWGVEPV